MAAGTSVRSSSSRFAASSAAKKLIPVALPPGRARLVTSPSLTGSSGTMNTVGIVVVACAAATDAGALLAAITLTLPANQLGRQLRQPVGLFSAQR